MLSKEQIEQYKRAIKTDMMEGKKYFPPSYLEIGLLADQAAQSISLQSEVDRLTELVEAYRLDITERCRLFAPDDAVIARYELALLAAYREQKGGK